MNQLNAGRIKAIARKEFFHILRDPFTMATALGLPVFMVTFYGYAIDFNIRHIALSAYDGDRTVSSRRLEDTMTSSQYFSLNFRKAPSELLKDIDAGQAKAALIIERNFEKNLGEGHPAHAQVLLDGSDNSTVGIIQGYLSGMEQLTLPRILPNPPPPPFQFKTRFLFNPELESQWFIIPGLTVVIIAVLSILLTTLTIAREWENGSMELLLSTPVQPIEIIIGKLVPYCVLGLIGVAFVYLAARLGFGVPFKGSHILFILGSLMFLGTYLAQGLLISVTIRKQQLSMLIGIISGLLPTLLLSGFIFSIEDMPAFFRYFTSILSARWFMTICRGLFLKGAGLGELATPFFALLIINIVLITVATKRFKKDLEP